MKNVLFVLVALVAVMFASCSKEEDAVNPVQKIKVFMSTPASGNTLKSASTTTDESKEIQNGDTVDVCNLIEIYCILKAQDKNGNKISGIWMFNLEESDDLYRRGNDVPSFYAEQSIISIKMTTLGLYQAVFRSKTGESFGFLIRNTGLPGEVGDEMQNDYAFRIESTLFWTDIPTKKGFTFFIKSDSNDFNGATGEGYNPSQDKDYFALIDCGGDSKIMVGDQVNYGYQKLLLKKCKYAPGYYYTSIISEDTPANYDGTYRLTFGLGEFGVNWWSFQSVYKSDWYKNGNIIFKTF